MELPRPSRPRYDSPVRRRILTFFSALSLILCLAVCGLWVFYGSREVGVELFEAEDLRIKRLALVYSAGTIQVHQTALFPPLSPESSAGFKEHGWRLELRSSMQPSSPLHDRAFATRAGFDWGQEILRDENGGLSDVVDAVAIPAWLLIVVSLALPVLKVLAWRHSAQAAAHGLCRQCGYDLRATPGRCPECGRGAAHDSATVVAADSS